MYEYLFQLSEFLDNRGLVSESNHIDQILEKAAKEKWMQEAVNPEEKGQLREKLNTPEGENIPVAKLEAEKKKIQDKGEGDKILSERDRKTLSQIQFALNARKSKAQDPAG